MATSIAEILQLKVYYENKLLFSDFNCIVVINANSE